MARIQTAACSRKRMIRSRSLIHNRNQTHSLSPIHNHSLIHNLNLTLNHSQPLNPNPLRSLTHNQIRSLNLMTLFPQT